MSNVNTTITELADEVRELSGKTEVMSIDTMINTLSAENNNFNTNLSTQENLIAQIQATVNSLLGAGGGDPSLQSKTVTPTTSTQTITADSNYDGLDTVTVNAIPSTYVKPNATKTATTYTPTISDQTITAGTYCSGVQTIKGDANLVAANIKSGVSIFGVIGSLKLPSLRRLFGVSFFLFL